MYCLIFDCVGGIYGLFIFFLDESLRENTSIEGYYWTNILPNVQYKNASLSLII